MLDFRRKKAQEDVHKKYMSMNQADVKQLLASLYIERNIPAKDIVDIVEKRDYQQDNTKFDYTLYHIAKKLYPESYMIYFKDSEEYKEWENLKIENNIFPMQKIKGTQLTDASCIVVVDTKKLVSWYNNNIINYNANTQRALIRSISDDNEVYKIQENQNSINEIKQLMLKGKYIAASPIILNLPIESDAYIEPDGIIIKRASQFDIVDGWHRLRAMIQASFEKKSFSMKVPVLFTMFDEGKARELIFQEDKKNPLRKVEKLALDKEFIGNKIINLLKSSSEPVCGYIKRNGIIDETLLSEVLRNRLKQKKSVGKAEEMRIIRSVSMKIINGLNNKMLLEEDSFNTSWSKDDIETFCNVTLNEV